MPEKLISFDEFRARVGAADNKVRLALRVLGLRPIPRFEDNRIKEYRPEWVEQVKEWIKTNMGN